MNSQLRNSLSARQYIPVGDFNNLPTMTEPDQTLSIKQLVERHVNGIAVGVREYEPFYSEEELPNFEFMDIEELHQYKEFLNRQKFLLEDKLRQQRIKDAEDAAAARQAAVAPPPQNTDHQGGMRQAPQQPPSPTSPL